MYRSEALGSGAVMHSWSVAAPRGVVVLQHGFAEYAERYQEQPALIPQLGAAGFDVIALDLWGHGRSPGRRGVTNVRLAVDDHLEVRRRAALGGVPVLLVGHSLGGLVTACSVRASPVELSGVVLLSPALSRPGAGFGAAWAGRGRIGRTVDAHSAAPPPRGRTVPHLHRR